MQEDAHPAVDEYLEMIGWLMEEDLPVVGARLAERTGRSRPSVSEMLERLASRGLVERRGREVLLTASGRERALAVIRRHRLAECLLVDLIGLPWPDVHLEADRFASVFSEEVEMRLVELLGNPATCPHGNPIPGGPEPPSEQARSFRLIEANPLAEVRLVRVSQTVELDRASLRYLSGAGFVTGAQARVTERGPDGTLVLSLGDERLALSPYLCERLFVVTTAA